MRSLKPSLRSLGQSLFRSLRSVSRKPVKFVDNDDLNIVRFPTVLQQSLQLRAIRGLGRFALFHKDPSNLVAPAVADALFHNHMFVKRIRRLQLH
jgi:hypothetical protein